MSAVSDCIAAHARLRKYSVSEFIMVQGDGNQSSESSWYVICKVKLRSQLS